MAFSIDVLTDTYIKLGIENTVLSKRINDNFDNNANTISYYGKFWSYEEEEVLRLLFNKGVPWPVISRLHGRTESALKARLKQFQNRPPPVYKNQAPRIASEYKKKDISISNLKTVDVIPKVNNIPDSGIPMSFDFSFQSNSHKESKTMKPDEKSDTSFKFTFTTNKNQFTSPINTTNNYNCISDFDPKKYQFNFTLNNAEKENKDKTLKEKEKDTSKITVNEIDDSKKVGLSIEKTIILDEKVKKEIHEEQNEKIEKEEDQEQNESIEKEKGKGKNENIEKEKDQGKNEKNITLEQSEEYLIHQISKISITHPIPSSPSSSYSSNYIKKHTDWTAEDDLLLVQLRAIKLTYKDISKLLSVERTPAAISNHYNYLKSQGVGFLEDYYSVNKLK